MSMFRRPTDDSSDSDSSSEESETEELDHSNAGTDHSNAGTEEIVGADLTTVRTLSSGESISIDHSRGETGIGDTEHVRNMMLASLLEDFYRTRAAELFNAANPGANFDRQSPEVQPLAKSLFAQASQALSSNGVLPVTVLSSEVQNTRGQYLAGLDNFGLQNIKDSELLSEAMKRRMSTQDNSLALVRANPVHLPSIPTSSSHPVHDLARRTESLGIIPHPTTDMKLSSIQSSHSHYKSSFQEMRLLGRGGFGRVYQTYNLFDKKEYAVKKIPLSTKLSQQYHEKGHTELTSILREVQALAQLDHCNVVRYHATWIEEPVAPFVYQTPPTFQSPFNRQRLLADKPTFSPYSEERRRSSARLLSYTISDGIAFEAESVDGVAAPHVDLGWSHCSEIRQRESSIPDSDIFTDDMAQHKRSDKAADDPSCYVLHVQMSMYPTTLAQYLSPEHAGSKVALMKPAKKHCFHLVPALHIMLGIMCGLQYIHGRGLVHRDIKPSNIFLSCYELENHIFSPEGFCNVGACPTCHDGRPFYVNPRIGDFGLVADLAHDSEPCLGSPGSSNGAVGTEYYRPPVGNGKKPRAIDEKLDVYALGVVFVEMLSKCGTSMERLNLLRGLQKGIVPQAMISAIEEDGYPPEIGEMIKDCVDGMIHRDHLLRWSCSKVKLQLEDVLTRCNIKAQTIS